MTQPDTPLLQTSRFSVVRAHYATPGGSQAREIVRHPGAVTILPLIDSERICLIRNFRVSVRHTLIELPAGTLVPGEDPQVAAQRELAEETGYQAARLERLRDFYLSPGILDERMHVFVATGLSAGGPAREPGELIENLIVTWDEAMAMVDAGQIQDAKTMVALLLYDRQRARQ